LRFRHFEEEHRIFVHFPLHVILKVILFHFLFFAGRQFLWGLNELDKSAALLRKLAGNRVLYYFPEFSLGHLLRGVVAHERVLENGRVIEEVAAVILEVRGVHINDFLIFTLQVSTFSLSNRYSFLRKQTHSLSGSLILRLRSSKGDAFFARKALRIISVIAHDSDMLIFLLLRRMKVAFTFVAHVRRVVIIFLVDGPP
jgi:hypothetical protein